ncbi:DNA polymerase III subunit alpha [Candidatus Uhrbacteria bacterium]|nr:DNA polymerase III subunit alpha [Candidatus Uhrbacteria bacterium]
MSFVHLHVHSHYSLLDGLGKIPDLVAAAKAQGATALALTDHGTLYGAVEFYQECLRAGIKPIIGMEAYVAVGSRHDKRSRVDNDYTHLVLLAENNTGYQNLLKLTTLGHIEGYYYKPRIDWELLQQFHEGLIALSGCLRGAVSREILSGSGDERAAFIIRQYQTVFGAENYFLEIQHRPSLPDQARVNAALVRLCQATGAGLVATNDAHYINPDDADAQDVLLCLQTKSKRDDPKRLNMMGENLSLIAPETMIQLFLYAPDAIANTAKIADRCSVEIPLGKVILPEFAVAGGANAMEELERLCHDGLGRMYGQAPATDVVERLQYELSVIAKTGFASYFLIVADFVNWAKRHGIMVGPGRGSAAGSLVSFLLNITSVDPVRYKLFFERFLNPERISMPDIDLDFADRRRDEVIHYVEQKYGKDHVAQIITFGTMAARASIRDCGRVLGMSYSFCDTLAKLIPMGLSLHEAVDQVPELKELIKKDEQANVVIATAQKVENVARHSSTHACGVVITDKPLVEYTPIQFASSSDQTIITQYGLHSIEALGLLKMDFLGLKNLTILEDALAIIQHTRSVTVDLASIPLDDVKAFTLLQCGDTTGVFQLESSGMKRYLKELKPTGLEDIIAMVALYRPGPMELIPDFIASKHGTKRIEYLHPKLQPILDYTYGIAVYQEQVLQIARDIAGFTLGEADVLRKAIGKKIKTLLMEQREKFIVGAIKQGVERSIAERLFDFTEPFARYGFNRAHATCYGFIAYQTAYLKANYPVEFMAALLKSEVGDVERIAVLVGECKGMGIRVLAPDINESFESFTVASEDATGASVIRFGLAAVKNVGEGIVDRIVSERKTNGPFTSLENFLLRVGSEVLNKKSLESFVKCGALDRFGDRSQLAGNIEKMLKFARSASSGQEQSAQSSLLSMMGASVAPRVMALDPIAPERPETLLCWEKELLGLYVSEHPLTAFSAQLSIISIPISTVKNFEERQEAVVGGLVLSIKSIYTKKGEKMLFAKVEDPQDSIEVIVFPETFQKTAGLWAEGGLVLLKGTVTQRGGAAQIVCSKAIALTPERIQELIAAMPKRPTPAVAATASQ